MGIWRTFTALFFKDYSACDTDRVRVERPRPTILAIDDDQQFLDAMKTLLTDAGFNVVTSSSGPKGLGTHNYAARDLRWCCWTTICRSLTARRPLQHVRKVNAKVRVLAITGVNINDLPPSFREGVDLFIQKPFLISQLIEALHKLVGDQPPNHIGEISKGGRGVVIE